MPDALTKDCQLTLSEVLRRQTPYLRRYARALTASQKVGDQAVANLLVALRSEPALLDPPPLDKADVFHLFHATLQRDPEVERTLPPVSRQFLLLTELEGLSAAKAASVLSVDIASVRDLEREGRRDLARFVDARIAVIEDEPAIAMDLEQLVQDLGHVVTGIADTHGRAVDLIRRTNPDLIISDIQLADGSSGIDAIDEISASYSVPVIFVTAYPERLLTSERVEPTYLIAKPYVDKVVQTTIAFALFNHGWAGRPEVA